MADAFDIEQPACFYLGREYDLASKSVLPDQPPVMIDARDFVTHGVIIGMTGSGKTGLGISLLEEAAIDGIPTIIIDPKGDLTNLLLQFPDLDPAKFGKWLDPSEARNRQQTQADYAASVAQRMRQGLADTLQSPERIALLRQAGDWTIYTPGSDAGLSLSLLKTFAPPPAGTPREDLNQRIDAIATALLGLTGTASDPVQSREHILIAQLLLQAWNKGEALDLARLITLVQKPPLRTIGAFDIETFYPETERLKLAVALNHILASPSFSTWIEGEPLDLEAMLASRDGRARQVIFYLAHLEDAQRMFFVALLLEEIRNWTRKQSGTTSLRALVYFDEVYGYLPPHPANPPTKVPLMTLMKQARAFGVGIVLATQNPVDLDYKALSNAGIWMVGKLQTERDKLRLLDGLEGVAAERGTLADRGYLEQVIGNLGNRLFLVHNVHRGVPVVMQTRYALSLLRGPLTRDQVAEVMRERKSQRAAPSPDEAAADAARATDFAFKERLRSRGLSDHASARHVAPVLPAGMPQFYVPADLPLVIEAGATRELVYHARLLGLAEVNFADKKRGLQFQRTRFLLAQPPQPGSVVAWHKAEMIPGELSLTPLTEAGWSEVPEAINTPRKLKALQKEFADYLYAHDKLRLFANAELKLLSEVGEDAASFQARCRDVAQRAAQAELSEVEPRYATKFARLRSALPVAPPTTKSSTLWDWAVMSWFRPERPIVLGPPARARADDRKSAKASQELRDLESEWEDKQAELFTRWRKIGEQREDVFFTPRKADVRVLQFGLAWVPFWLVQYPDGRANAVATYRTSSEAV